MPIAQEPTVSYDPNRQAKSPDAEASLRHELSSKISAAQTELEVRLTDLLNSLATASNGLAITQAEAQLRGLALLQKRIDRADPASLSAMRAEIAASVAATQSFVQQVQSAGTGATADKVSLEQASEAARGSVTDFMHAYYDERKFDRYLQFASKQDEEEYRKREEERHREIAKAMAEHTPEGDLRAARLSVEQIKDAGVHGADKSRDYQPTLDGLRKNADNLQAQVDRLHHAQQTLSAANGIKESDPSAALKAAGVVLADDGAAILAAPRDQTAKRDCAS